jgi:putative acetyltransferase
VSSLFALLLFLALALTGVTAFVGQRFRPSFRWALRAALVLVWAALFVSLWQIGLRTSLALVAPGSARRPQIIESALGELFTLLLSLGSPAALVTFLGMWCLRATRPARPDQKGPERRQLKRKRSPAKLIAVQLPGKDLDDTMRLFEEYARALDFDLGFPLAGFHEEIRTLPGPYVAPTGKLLLARLGNQAAGCIALREVGNATAELGRLFVRPDFRHAGLGRTLVELSLELASEWGCRQIRLDTLPAMREATGLFRSFGFRERGPFGETPTPGGIFFERELRAKK